MGLTQARFDCLQLEVGAQQMSLVKSSAAQAAIAVCTRLGQERQNVSDRALGS